MPLKVAPLGKAASAAPVTPVSCAAAGAGATTLLASPSIAVNRNPSRVIVSSSAAMLLVDLDVPADNWARATLVDVGAELVGVCDLELVVVVLAGLPIVLDVRLETGRSAVRAAGARELCGGGSEHRHESDRAIEVSARDVVQVIEMAAASHPSLVFRVEAEAALAARDVDLDLAAAGSLPRGYAADAWSTRGGRGEPGRVVDPGADHGARAWANRSGAVRVTPPVTGAIDGSRTGGAGFNCDPEVGDSDVEVVLGNVSRCVGCVFMFEPHCYRTPRRRDQNADGVTLDNNTGRVRLQADGMDPA